MYGVSLRDIARIVASGHEHFWSQDQMRKAVISTAKTAPRQRQAGDNLNTPPTSSLCQLSRKLAPIT